MEHSFTLRFTIRWKGCFLQQCGSETWSWLEPEAYTDTLVEVGVWWETIFHDGGACTCKSENPMGKWLEKSEL